MMKKILIITEKPSVAREIANAIGNYKNNGDYIEALNYVISWAHGHLLSFAYPQDYDVSLKKWSLATIPIIPDSFKYKILDAKRLNVLKRLIEQADVVVNACDAGREGELIFREIVYHLNVQKPLKRMWLQSLTKTDILKELNNLKDLSLYDNLYNSALAREKADWLVGINATRAISVKASELYTVGRVQTPTLFFIVSREREIQNFRSTTYYVVKGLFHSEEYEGTYFKTFDSLEQAKALQSLKGKEGIVRDFSEYDEKDPAPILYNLLDLQKEANSLYKFSASKTLALAQSLYEKGLISYPRTDSRYITKSMVSEVSKLLTPLKSLYSHANTAKPSYANRYARDEKVTDHYGLIPTYKLNSSSYSSLSEDEKKIVDLISLRFLASLHDDAVVQKQKFVTVVEKEHIFETKRNALVYAGWRVVYGEKSVGRLLPVSGVHTLKEVVVSEEKTKPKPRYTDGRLLEEMEKCSRYIQDPELKKLLNGVGIGTPATRSQIIERLLESKYVVKKSNVFYPTEKGIKLISSLEQLNLTDLMSPALTAYWEGKLLQIEEGTYTAEHFLSEIVSFVRLIVDKIKSQWR
ncbi:MAG: DNA topoisomerase [Conexivisphaerales archaeon]